MVYLRRQRKETSLQSPLLREDTAGSTLKVDYFWRTIMRLVAHISFALLLSAAFSIATSQAHATDKRDAAWEVAGALVRVSEEDDGGTYADEAGDMEEMGEEDSFGDDEEMDSDLTSGDAPAAPAVAGSPMGEKPAHDKGSPSTAPVGKHAGE